jgi:hypothetical protein
MTTNSSVNLEIANLSVGFSIAGGSTKRTFTLNGAGNTTLTSQQNIVLTLPNRATDTVVGYGDYTAKGVLLAGTAAGAFNALSVGTNNYVLTADSAETDGVKWAPPSAAPGVTSWTDVTGTTQTMASNSGYFADNASAVAFTLPATAAKFEFMEIVGIQGSWNIIQGTGQSISFGNVTTTTGAGGSLASTFATDSIKLQCIVANTKWQVVSAVGNITYV